MFCRNCGAEIREGAFCCRKCGTRVKTAKKGLGKGIAIGIAVPLAAVSVIVVLLVLSGVLRKEPSEGNREIPEPFAETAGDAGLPSEKTIDDSEPGETYPVTLCLYPAMGIRTREREQGIPITGVTAYIRRGSGIYSGEAEETVTAEMDGTLHVDLPVGTYTARFAAEGYLDAYLEFAVDGEEVSRAAYAVAGLTEDQTAVVLTWDGDGMDLDLILVTSRQSAGDDMDHVGGCIIEDGHGSSLVTDNDRECEMLLINADSGGYKLYVNNYTDIQAGNYESGALCRSNAHIYVYDSRGFVADYPVPEGQSGVVWEVAERNGNMLAPRGYVYAGISGRDWWLEEKSERRLMRTMEERHTDIDEVSEANFEYVYDSYGNLTELRSYDDTGFLQYTTTYLYNDQGDLVQEDGSGGFGGGYTEYFDEQGRLTERITYDMFGNLNTRSEYDYDSQGNRIKSISYYSDGSVSGWDEYTYDSCGNQMKWIMYGGDGSVSRWEEYTYDSYGNWIKWVVYHGDGSVSGWQEYAYDNYGNQVKRVVYNGDGSVSGWQEYAYDSYGNQVKQVVYNGDGSVSSWTDYVYDIHGNRIKGVSYSEDENISSWTENCYDNWGNMTKSVSYKSDGSIMLRSEYCYE